MQNLVFSAILVTLKPFLITCVVDKPMVPFLYDDLFEVVKNATFINVKPGFTKNEFLLRLFEKDLSEC